MKILFNTFKKSLYDPAFYRSIATAPFSDSLRYYIKMTSILALFITIVFAVRLVPHGVSFIKNDAPALVKQYYPAELAVTLAKGEASVNVPEPYIIPAQGGVKDAIRGAALPVENILVIDTQNEFTKKAFEDHKTFALLTKHEIVTRSDRGQITIQDLRGAPDMLVDQATVLGWVERVQGSLATFVSLGIFMTLIALFVGFSIYLLVVLLFALIPFFLAWVKKVPLTYTSAYKMSLYAVMPGLVLKTFLNSLGFFFVPASLTFLVFLLVISLNMREVEQPNLFEN